jgi:hypothetical protein
MHRSSTVGMPKWQVPPPAFGIAVRRTGWGTEGPARPAARSVGPWVCRSSPRSFAVIPSGAHLWAQPQPCNHCREAFHHAHPPEAVALHPPASCEAPTPREIPNTRPPATYPDRFEGRDVSATGGIRWTHPWGNLTITCARAYVGIEDIDDGVWNVDCGPLIPGRRHQ